MNRLRFIVALIITVTGCGQFLYGQSGFHPGYVINLKSDTIFGEIDSRGAVSNAQTCYFRKGPKDEIAVYNPDNIIAYRLLNDKYYISKALSDSAGSKIVFLEYLLHGIVDLYYFETSDNKRFYIQKEGGPMLELSNDVIIHNMIKNSQTGLYESTADPSSVSQYKRSSQKYIGILKATFSDCPQVQKELNRTLFDSYSLTRVTKDYHQYTCDSFKCISYLKLVKPKFLIGPAVRYALVHLIQGSYGLGASMDMGASFFNEKMSFLVEGYFSNMSGTDSVLDYYAKPRRYNTRVISGKSIELMISLKYTYPRGKIRPIAFIGGGYCYEFNYKEKSIDHIANKTYTWKRDNQGSSAFNLGTGFEFHLNKKNIIFMHVYIDANGLDPCLFLSTGIYL